MIHLFSACAPQNKNGQRAIGIDPHQSLNGFSYDALANEALAMVDEKIRIALIFNT
jgi:hypothetical protein